MIECNKEVVDYLDVTFDLNDGTYKAYHILAQIRQDH